MNQKIGVEIYGVGGLILQTVCNQIRAMRREDGLASIEEVTIDSVEEVVYIALDSVIAIKTYPYQLS